MAETSRPSCLCGLRVTCLAVRIVNANHNRRFYVCPNRQCTFFSWAPNSEAVDVGPQAGQQTDMWPMCHCGINAIKKRDDETGSMFFACALVADSGAGANCDFEQWCDVSSQQPLPQTRDIKAILSRTLCNFAVVGDHFVLSITGDACTLMVKNAMKTVADCTWNGVHYVIPAKQYNNVLKLLESIQETTDSLEIVKLPQSVVSTLFTAPEVTVTDLKSKLPSTLVEKMMPFQMDGVEFAVKHEGRALIADSMGLGKTLQAIAVGTYYRDEWPMLVVTPSSVRLPWKDELLKWLPREWIRRDQIEVVMTGRDSIMRDVTIISYDLAVKCVDRLNERKYGVVIADESHYLKNRKAQRSKSVLPLLHNARRAILLTGTPALNRPEELWTQLNALHQSRWPAFGTFANRYCDAHQGPFGWDTTGASNLSELHGILESTVMIRRLKKNVLKQLPPKRRQQISVTISHSAQTKLAKLLIEARDMRGQMSIAEGEDLFRLGGKQRILMNQLLKETGLAKVPSTNEYVTDLINSDAKFLLFAHHIAVLDGLEANIKKRKAGYIRIDGRTPVSERHELVKRFQTRDTVQVALLSITAAGQGLTLNAASNVVFAELYWVPGILVQAEDRAHRIGQCDSVNIHYLVADKTGDSIVWPVVQGKLEVVGESLDGVKSHFDAKRVDQKQRLITGLFKPVLGMETDDKVKEQADRGLDDFVSQEQPEDVSQPEDDWGSADEVSEGEPAGVVKPLFQSPPVIVLESSSSESEAPIKRQRVRRVVTSPSEQMTSEQMKADEEFARKLQADFDAETSLL